MNMIKQNEILDPDLKREQEKELKKVTWFRDSNYTESREEIVDMDDYL